MNKKTLLFALILSILVFYQCKPETDKSPEGIYSNGVFITNEGAFQTGTGTITFFNPDSNTTRQDIFEAVNSRPLGNVVQSIAIWQGKAYIVVNNAAKIEVVDVATFKASGTISNLGLPRFFLPVSASKAYVSDWAGCVDVIDLLTNTLTSTIKTGAGPEALVRSGKYVFVANSGGFTSDSTISVIDPVTEKVVKQFVTGHNPSGLVVDKSGLVWVFCKGKGFPGWPAADDTPGKIAIIDPVSLTISTKYIFPSTGDHPEKPVIDTEKSVIYFLLNNAVYTFSTNAISLQPQKWINRSFYSLAIDPSGEILYASDPRDYQQKGWVLRYKTANASLVDSVRAGVIPGGFAFTEE